MQSRAHAGSGATACERLSPIVGLVLPHGIVGRSQLLAVRVLCVVPIVAQYGVEGKGLGYIRWVAQELQVQASPQGQGHVEGQRYLA